MKKISMFFLLAVSLTLYFSMETSAAEKFNGKFRYEIVQTKSGKKEVKIVKGTMAGTSVIPSKINGYPVTEIGKGAFDFSAERSELMYIHGEKAWDIPEFLASTKKKISIPSTVRKIGEKAFANNAITKVTIPSSVTFIGNEAFASNNITSVTIPNSVKTLGMNIFHSNPLKKVTLPKKFRLNSYGDLYYKVIKRNGNKEIQITGYNVVTTSNTLTIPSTINNIPVTEIGEKAFAPKQNHIGVIKNSLNIKLPNSIRIIRKMAFEGLKLKSMTLPTKLEVIEERAFKKTNLTSIKMNRKLKYIGKNAFSNNVLTSVQLPNSVTHIGEEAFYSNNLKSVILPDKLTVIRDGVFAYNQIDQIKLPNTIVVISNRAFYSNKVKN